MWGYIVVGLLNSAAFCASIWLAGQNLSGFGVAFLAWPLLAAQLVACLPASVFAVIPRKSRVPRRTLAFLVAALLIASLCVNIYAIASYKAGDD